MDWKHWSPPERGAARYRRAAPYLEHMKMNGTAIRPTSGMTRRQRLKAALAGKPVDRVPVSAWGHFFTEEVDPDRFVAATLDFQQRYDWDFLNMHSRASYPVEGWGYTFAPSTDPARDHVCTGHPIAVPADWRKIKPLGLDTPALAEQLKLVERLRAQVGADLPLIVTVFSPLDVAEKLAGHNSTLLKQHIEADPAGMGEALESIAVTFASFVREVARLGADGIFFSTKWANNLQLSPDQYQRLVHPNDLAVLAEANPEKSGLWCNLLHLCEDHVQLSAMADYPVQVIHWDAHAGHNPSFVEGRQVVRSRLHRAMGGGVDPKTLAAASAAEVEAMAVHAIRGVGGRGFVLGSGCSVQMASTPPENLLALRRAPALAALEMLH
jgi:uroporphyrinogen decarboxylase